LGFRFPARRSAWSARNGPEISITGRPVPWAFEPRAVPYTWDRYPWAEAITYAARGLGAARAGDVETAERSLVELERLEKLAKDSWWRGRIQVRRDVISGWVAYHRGETQQARTQLSRAAEQELAAGKQSVEPGHIVYASEQLGELLLKLNRPHDAFEVFRRGLEDSPRRFHALFGAGKAAAMANMQKEAVDYYTTLTTMVVDTNQRPQTQHAAQFLAEWTP